jgi:4-diphosphocytidyl-2-C-methyl-D-erythritol kinase
LSANIAEDAPAKVNLALHVTGRRADGYHLLESLVVFAGIGDELRAREAETDSLRVSGPFADQLTGGPSNLVLKAATAFRERFPTFQGTGLAIELFKNLPVSAGLGGGSADAAAILRMIAAHATEPVSEADLLELASGIGADVPVCLYSRPAEIAGVGERITPLPEFPDCHLVLINPLKPIATAEVFRRLNSRENPPLPPLPEGLSRPAVLALWLEETRNDLQETAIGMDPVIGQLIARVAATQGCSFARMSGSGATVFGLFGSGAAANQAAHDLREQWPGFWVAAAPVIGVS